jgi:hypothetical protein
VGFAGTVSWCLGAIHAADRRQCAMSEAQPLVVIIDDDPDIRNALIGLLETVDLQARCLLPPRNSWLANAHRVRAASSSTSGFLV